MPISIPKINRIQQSSTVPQNDRINLNVKNNASDILSQTNAVAGFAEKGLDIYQKYEDDKINQLSSEAEMEFKLWNNEKLRNLKSYEGDPTDAYAQHEKETEEKFKELIERRPDLNERVKNHLSANLSDAMNKERMHVLSQRGAQVETYQNNLYESSLKLKKDDLGMNASYIRIDDPSSFLLFDENIADIKSTIAKRGISKGIATRLPDDAKSWHHLYKDEEGKVVKVQFSDIAKARVAKELNEGISESIKSMVASGYTEEAKAAYEKYKDYLDPKAERTINSKFRNEGIKSSAYDEIGKIEGKSEAEQMKIIESIKDPEIKSEVLKIKDTNDRRRESIRERRENLNYDTLAKRVLKRMNSDSPYYGVADLESDPVFKQTFDRLSSKQQKSILEAVNAPKETNSKSEISMQNLFFGNGDKQIEDVSPEEFNTYLSGLNSSDRKKYTNMYNRMKTETAAEERSTFKRAGDMLKNQLLIDEHIEKDKYGKLSSDDEITLLKAQNKLIDHLSKQGAMNEKQLNDFVKEFSAAEIKGKAFSPTPRPIFNAPAKVQSNVIPSGKNEVIMSPKEIISHKKAFRDQFGYFPTTKDEKFKNYLKNKKG